MLKDVTAATGVYQQITTILIRADMNAWKWQLAIREIESAAKKAGANQDSEESGNPRTAVNQGQETTNRKMTVGIPNLLTGVGTTTRHKEPLTIDMIVVMRGRSKVDGITPDRLITRNMVDLDLRDTNTDDLMDIMPGTMDDISTDDIISEHHITGNTAVIDSRNTDTDDSTNIMSGTMSAISMDDIISERRITGNTPHTDLQDTDTGNSMNIMAGVTDTISMDGITSEGTDNLTTV